MKEICHYGLIVEFLIPMPYESVDNLQKILAENVFSLRNTLL